MTGRRFEYNDHYFQKLVKKESWKAIYKHWTNWCYNGKTNTRYW